MGITVVVLTLLVAWVLPSGRCRKDFYGREYKDCGNRIRHPAYKRLTSHEGLEYRQIDVVFHCGAGVSITRKVLLARPVGDDRWLIEPRRMEFSMPLLEAVDPPSEVSNILVSRLTDGWKLVEDRMVTTMPIFWKLVEDRMVTTMPIA